MTERDWADAHLINAAVDIHHDDPEFGYRFIADELPLEAPRPVGNRVSRLCSQQRLWSAHAKKRGLTRKPGPPVHDDLVEPSFGADELDRLWLTDITEHPTGEGKLYLCAVKDACSRRIIGYSMAERTTSQLGVDASSTPSCDAGPRRRSCTPTAAASSRRTPSSRLSAPTAQGSMGRVGACADNAAMESFFSLLQKNVPNRRRWATRRQLRLVIISWIENTYHRRRRQPALARLTPFEFVILLQATQAA